MGAASSCRQPSIVESVTSQHKPAQDISNTQGTSSKSSTDSTTVFDPFSIFQVKPQECHILTVRVIRGRNITLGRINDFFDTPDPYVKLQVPEAGSLVRFTKVIDNNVNPEWNEMFRFILNPRIKNTLDIEIWDKDYNADDFVASTVYDLDNVPLGAATKVTVKFVENITIDLELTRRVSEHADIRVSQTLCEEEKEFVHDRKQKVLQAMQEAFGDEGPQNVDEVPVIGVMGSGGGFRAMTAFCGVVSALSECGILDMTTYLAGLSGSSWYMGHLYCQPEWPDKMPKDLQELLKNRITKHWLKKALTFSFMKRFRKLFQDKRSRGQPFSLTDFYGMSVGEVLLGKENNGYLSDQKVKIGHGDLPLPLYTAARVEATTSEEEFSEWLEFSPYEISMLKYGVSFKPQMLNSKFYLGRVEEQYPEPNFHFLLGVFGSVCAILFRRLLAGTTETSTTTGEKTETSEITGEDSSNLEDLFGESKESLPLDELENQNLNSAQTDTKDQTPCPGQKDSKILKLLMSSELFNSRKFRAAEVLNFCSGIDLRDLDAFSPFSCADEIDKHEFIDKTMPDEHSLYVVDAGLGYLNLPTPILLRPQRHVDVIISFDFSTREDGVCPLKDLRRSEIWAKQHGVPFPPITISEETVQREGVKECYVFKHPEDDHCPMVVHFVLVNDTFKTFKRPGEPRVTPEDKEFGNFSIFEDKDKPYSTMKLTYTDKSFERIVQLMSYNTLNHKKEILDAIKGCISRRRQTVQENGVSWDVLQVVSQAAKNFSKLAKNPDVSAEGLKKLEKLIKQTQVQCDELSA